MQVWAYERSGGRIRTRSASMSDLLLRTVGRKSGRRNDACLPYWIDIDEERIVVASMGGGPRHPAWYHNLRDHAANPELRVRDGRRVFWASAAFSDVDGVAFYRNDERRERSNHSPKCRSSHRSVPQPLTKAVSSELPHRHFNSLDRGSIWDVEELESTQHS